MGNGLATILNQFQMSEWNLTEPGFELETFGLTCQRSYQVSKSEVKRFDLSQALASDWRTELWIEL